MGYSYVYPPLKPAADSKSETLPSGNLASPASSPAKPPPPSLSNTGVTKPLLPNLNPQKEFQSFLNNIGSQFNFAARREPEPAPSGQQQLISADLASRPSESRKRIRKRPLQRKRPQNLPRRRIDPGKSRNFLGNLMDMDALGTQVQSTVIDENKAAHRYESIPILASTDEIR